MSWPTASATLPPLAANRRRPRRLDDVAGRRFRGFEEVEESFFSRAISACRRAFSASSSAILAFSGVTAASISFWIPPPVCVRAIPP